MDDIEEKRLQFLKYLKDIYPGIFWVEIIHGEFHIVDIDGAAFWEWDAGEGKSHLIPGSFEGYRLGGVGSIGEGLAQFVHWYHHDDLKDMRDQIMEDEDRKWEIQWHCNSYRRTALIDLELTKFLDDEEIYGLDDCSRITYNKDKVTCPECKGYIDGKYKWEDEDETSDSSA